MKMPHEYRKTGTIVCRHCGKTATRRLPAEYCSTRCRVAALRERRKYEGMNSDQRFAEALARLREDAARLGQLLADYEELARRFWTTKAARRPTGDL